MILHTGSPRKWGISATWTLPSKPGHPTAPPQSSLLPSVRPHWGTILASGEGDAALAWEGLRADWQGKGLEFEYWLGQNSSKFPANVFVARRSDFEDPQRRGQG